jgi:hypothetical protein
MIKDAQNRKWFMRFKQYRGKFRATTPSPSERNICVA